MSKSMNVIAATGLNWKTAQIDFPHPLSTRIGCSKEPSRNGL